MQLIFSIQMFDDTRHIWKMINAYEKHMETTGYLPDFEAIEQLTLIKRMLANGEVDKAQRLINRFPDKSIQKFDVDNNRMVKYSIGEYFKLHSAEFQKFMSLTLRSPVNFHYSAFEKNKHQVGLIYKKGSVLASLSFVDPLQCQMQLFGFQSEETFVETLDIFEDVVYTAHDGNTSVLSRKNYQVVVDTAHPQFFEHDTKLIHILADRGYIRVNYDPSRLICGTMPESNQHMSAYIFTKPADKLSGTKSDIQTTLSEFEHVRRPETLNVAIPRHTLLQLYNMVNDLPHEIYVRFKFDKNNIIHEENSGKLYAVMELDMSGYIEGEIDQVTVPTDNLHMGVHTHPAILIDQYDKTEWPSGADFAFFFMGSVYQSVMTQYVATTLGIYRIFVKRQVSRFINIMARTNYTVARKLIDGVHRSLIRLNDKLIPYLTGKHNAPGIKFVGVFGVFEMLSTFNAKERSEMYLRLMNHLTLYDLMEWDEPSYLKRITSYMKQLYNFDIKPFLKLPIFDVNLFWWYSLLPTVTHVFDTHELPSYFGVIENKLL